MDDEFPFLLRPFLEIIDQFELSVVEMPFHIDIAIGLVLGVKYQRCSRQLILVAHHLGISAVAADH